MSEMQPLDEDLLRLFEGARSELPSAAFLERIELRMARARSVRLAVQIGLLILLAVAVAIVTPEVTRESLAGGDYLARWLPDLGLALSSPLGWVCSLILGAWVLKRTHVFER